MGFVVIGDTPRELPLTHQPIRIYVKEQWRQSWQYRPDLEHIRHNYRVAKAGTSEAEFRSRYGLLKQPYETEITQHDPLDIRDFWVRIDGPDPLNPDTYETQFVGIIYNDVRDMRGAADQIAGKQPWVAYGPKHILENIDVSDSYWMDDDDEVHIMRLPSKNTRDKRKLLVGNRSDDRGTDGDGAYLFGGKSIWTNLQMAEYFIERHVSQVNGPEWTLGGQLEILEGITENIEFTHVEKVSAIFDKLMKREYALDYKINYTDRGFEIYVFSQLSEDNFFGDQTLPSNPDIVRYEQGSEIETTEVSVVRSRSNMVDSVRLIGKPLVMCASLGGPNSDLEFNDLLPNWSDDLEADYIAGTDVSASDSIQDDNARRRDRFKSVFQQFTAPADWDHRGGTLAPLIGLDGTIQEDAADYQNSVRATLHWLPMKRDFDYSQDPAVDNTESDAEPELQAPAAYIYNTDVNGDSSQGYIECHLHGMSVGVPHNELGVVVNASPNHLLALNHAFEPGSDEEESTDHEPLYDYDTLIATIAWETDQRLQVGFDVSNALAVGDGSKKIFYFDDAEMWLLAPNTVVGVDAAGGLQTSGADLRILRDDTPRLALIAAGVIARYVDERVRSEINKRGMWPFAQYLGQILQASEAGAIDYVGAPITMIEWTSGGGSSAGTTVVKTGYAE